MFKVLIVDDEPIHRRGLTGMIARLRPEYEVADAKNGLEALDYVRMNQVDILITDIQMPVMNGLELIEKLKGITPRTKIIILSVYGYFDYAQQALKLGACDYILKPVDEDKVEQVLSGVEEKLHEEQERQNEAVRMKSKLDHMLPEVMEHKLNKLVHGVLDRNGRVELVELFTMDSGGYVVVFDLYRNLSAQDGVSRTIMASIDKILNCNGTSGRSSDHDLDLEQYRHSVSFFLQDESESIVSIIETSCEANQMKKLLEKLSEEIWKEYGVLLTAGFSDPHDVLFQDAGKAFRQARKALACRFFTGKGSVISYCDLILQGERRMISSEHVKELVDALLKLDSSSAWAITDAAVGELLETGYPEVDEFKGGVSRFMENCIRTVDEKLKATYLKKFKNDIDPGMLKSDSLESLMDRVRQILTKLVVMLREQKQNLSGNIIDTCMRYIDEHYMEELSLEAVAAEFHFSSSYFSNIFKCNTNMNFSEYLNRTRMSNAKRLLCESCKKVYEISKMVGYQDPKYFSRLFKKECGLTPEEYRRISGRNRLEGVDQNGEEA